MEIIKITPDKERAKSILKMTCLIEERIKIQNKEKMAALIITDYYEIIKELITAILLIDGYKILSHKDLIDYLKEKYFDKFNAYDVSVLDDLRILRNRIAYEGFFVEPSYLDRNKTVFTKIIKKLKELIENKLK